MFLDIPPSGGHIDSLAVTAGRLTAHGWMFQPGCTFDWIEVFVNGSAVGRAQQVERPDVDRVHQWARGASPSGFVVETTFADTATRMDLIGYAGNRPVARLSSLIPSQADALLPQPPDHLAVRVSGLRGPMFDAQGLKMFTDLTDQMNRTGFIGGPIPREDGSDAPTQQVFPRAA